MHSSYAGGVPSPPGRGLQTLSLSLWERLGEGFHTALHSFYAVGVSSPPGRGLQTLSLSLWKRLGEGFHTALHSFYAGGVPSPNLPQRGRDNKKVSVAPSELTCET